MTLQDVLEAQIDAAIRGLMHARAGLAAEADASEPHEVARQLETVSHHLQDIQYNWLSLSQVHRQDGRLAAGVSH
jgi:hypothetical protein